MANFRPPTHLFLSIWLLNAPVRLYSIQLASDKFPLLSNQSKCDESQFECENGVCNKNNPLCSDSCVPEYWVNDSEDDCTDASDEIDYDREINCHWSIYAPNSTKLVLTFNDFQVIF